MAYTLEIRAFFFNAKTDYLPYYKHFLVTLDESANVKELLAKIQAKNENFAYPKQRLVFKINGLVVEAKQSIKEVVERLGTSLQIDPVNTYRSNHGLKINNKDFMESFQLLEPFASSEDLTYYKTLYALHYASETSNFNRKYIGDAILILAHKMITEGSEYKEEILKAIANVESGLFDCEYENNLFKAQDYTSVIEELKMMAKPPKAPSFMDKLATHFAKKRDKKGNMEEPIIESFEGKQIAYYTGGKIEKRALIHQHITQADAKVVSFSRENKLSGLSLLEDNKTLAYTKAATTLLDAMDSGAEVLVVEDEKVLSMFKKHFSAIEKTIGREIYLELISSDDFIARGHLIEA